MGAQVRYGARCEKRMKLMRNKFHEIKVFERGMGKTFFKKFSPLFNKGKLSCRC